MLLSFTSLAAGKTPPQLSGKEEADLKALFDNWSSLYAEGKIILRPNGFWTEAGSYWRLPHIHPELCEDLKQSQLVIYKGDLNYRKLTGESQRRVLRAQTNRSS
jgi:hypothetical protein